MQGPIGISRGSSNFDSARSPMLHPALSTSLSRSFGLNSPFSLNAMSTSLTQLSSSPGFSSMSMSLGRSFEERPKLEAQFFRNFSCCGLDLQDLHGLLEHFEECHVAFEGDDSQTEAGMDQGMDLDNGESDGTISGPPSPRLAPNRNVFELKKSSLGAFDSPGPSAAELHPDSGMELDMELEDEESSSPNGSTTSSAFNGGSMSAFENSLPLHGGKKFATAMNQNPIGGRGLQMNGLIGLDALAAARTAGGIAPNSTGYQTPDASVPGTPVMEDVAGAGVDGMFTVPPGQTNTSQALGLAPSLLFPTSPAGSPPEESESNAGSPPPDQPKSLTLNLGGGDGSQGPKINFLPPSNPLSQMPSALHPLGTGVQISPSGRPYTPPSEKPFKCSVQGCDKSYKQQNGLKYHRLHGHCNQNAVNDDEGGAEGKPYVCHVISCGKRYKNMNGLRYHYQHSGAHGALGLQMLAQSCHPPPQFPPGHKRKLGLGGGGPGTPTGSAPQSRAASPAGSFNSVGSVSRQSSPSGLNFGGGALQMGGVASVGLAFPRAMG